ncbi:MAG: cyclic pyranopterin monophosphate synthase MoaC [Acidobacteriota bacterium]
MGDDELTHLDERGQARMVDVGDKSATRREAVAAGLLRMSPDTRRKVLDGELPKGNVVEVARIAGIQAAKRTSDLIPLCHPLPLAHVDVDVEAGRDGLVVTVSVATTARTGVEMEALTGASVALLTLYDMCKAVDRSMVIEDVRLLEKRGGRSGHWVRET